MPENAYVWFLWCQLICERDNSSYQLSTLWFDVRYLLCDYVNHFRILCEWQRHLCYSSVRRSDWVHRYGSFITKQWSKTHDNFTYLSTILPCTIVSSDWFSASPPIKYRWTKRYWYWVLLKSVNFTAISSFLRIVCFHSQPSTEYRIDVDFRDILNWLSCICETKSS